MTRTIVLTGSRLAVIAVIFLAIILAVAAVMNYSARAAEARAVESMSKDAGQVTAGELAQWIVSKNQDYQLIDLREPWQFDDFHIPGAINIPFDQIFVGDNLARLDKGKKIVVYGLGAGRAAQVQLLLSMKGYRAFALNDGIIAWWDEVMTPNSLRNANPSSSGYQQARQLREYFMKGERSSEPPAAAVAPLPQPAAPAPASPAAKPAPKTATAAPAAKPAAKPQAKPQPKPAKTPAETAPPPDKEQQRLKLGAGCS